MTEQQLERRDIIMSNVEALRLSLVSLNRFEQDIPHLRCEFTRVSLLGLCTWNVEIPLESSRQITSALRSVLRKKMAQYKKEFDELQLQEEKMKTDKSKGKKKKKNTSKSNAVFFGACAVGNIAGVFLAMGTTYGIFAAVRIAARKYKEVSDDIGREV